MATKKPSTARATPDTADVIDSPPAPAEITDHAQAAEKRKAAAFDQTPDRKLRAEIEALLVERRGYVTREMVDRVEQVDQQILLRGGTPPADA